MKKNFLNILSLALVPALVFQFSACSRERAQLAGRSFIPDKTGAAALPGENGAGGENAEGSTLRSALLAPQDGEAPSACAAIEALKSSQLTNGYRFSFLDEIRVDAATMKHFGKINFADSPFTQVMLGEKFKFPTGDEFYAQAKAKHDAGEIDFLKWAALNAAVLVPSLYLKLQVQATNEVLEKKFPGIYGEPAEFTEESLHYQLLEKTGAMGLETGLSEVLTAKLPLFNSQGWGGVAADLRTSLQAAIASVARKGDTREDKMERLCGFVLWQRAFAQMLAFKGHISPALNAGHLPKLTDHATEFPKFEDQGALYDDAHTQAIVLNPADIQNYNPSARALSVRATLPNGLPVTQTGGLAAQLDLLESAVYMLDATHPGSAWFADRASYPLGNILDPRSPAILPPDAHLLALGMVKLSFKNMSALYIKQVTAAGTVAGEGEAPAGIALVSPRDMEQSQTTLRLTDVARFTRVVVDLERLLDQVAGDVKTGTSWYLTDPSMPYADQKIRAQLLGESAVGGKEAFEKLLLPEERQSILKDGLFRLHAPLALLLGQMSHGPGGCASEVLWNLRDGSRRPTAKCTDAQHVEARDAIRLLGILAHSPVLANSL